MNCPDSICRLVTCPVTDDIPSYLGSYSLQSGFQFVNLAISVPFGGGFYIQPPGTIVINLPPNPTVVSYMGCASMVSENVPAGSSPAQIQAIVADVMSQVATQAAGCNAPTPVSNPFVSSSFTNGPVTVGCDAGMGLSQVGDLPAGVTFSIGGLTLVGGVFSSGVSQADADEIAELYLDTLFGVSVICGWYNTTQNVVCCDMTTQTVAADTIFSTVSQDDADAQAMAQATAACPTCYWNTEQSYTCPDSSVKTVPAHTYMSIISQADADAQALAAAQAECPTSTCQALVNALVWTVTPTNPYAGDGFSLGSYTASASGGNISFSISCGNTTVVDLVITATLKNTTGSTCNFLFASSDITVSASQSSCTGDIGASGEIDFAQGTTGLLQSMYDLVHCRIVNNSPLTFVSFSLADGATANLKIHVIANGGNPGSGSTNGSASADITLSAV